VGDLFVFTVQIRLRPDEAPSAAGPLLRESAVSEELAGRICDTIIRMRRSDEPGFGRSLPDASDSLAARLAHLPDAHPAAWPASELTGNGRPARASARWRGETDAWWRGQTDAGWRGEPDAGWRGEPDAWWRGPDPSAAEAASDGDFDEIDDVDGLDDLDGLGDVGDSAGPGGTAEPGDAADGGHPGEAEARPGRSGGGAVGDPAGRSTAGPGRSGHQDRDGLWKPHAGPAGPFDELYRPWFSTGGGGDPWFAAGPERHGPAG
jgi:hypothetical protein